jgi:hypothetical protein
MSKYLSTTNRTIAWFKKANDANDLEMKPPFQRNPVWTDAQKSYLIDTALRGLPIPELYMQEVVDEEGNEKQIVIDGQQRIRACLQFIEGRYAISEEESTMWGGTKFDELSPDEKRRFYGYTFMVRVLPQMSDEELRGIFQRLNKNVVALNAQELRQATYWGPFLKTMQELSDYSYWNTTGIFTPLNTRRMQDVEYISEIAVAVLHGHQNKKETLDKYYEAYEEQFDSREDLTKKFRTVLFELEHLYPDIKNTRWKKKTDFYSLFLFLSGKVDYLPLSKDARLALRKILDKFASDVTSFLSTEDGSFDIRFDPDVESYAKSIRASSDIGNRKRRGIALENITADFFASLDAAPDAVVILPLAGNIFEVDPQDEQE